MTDNIKSLRPCPFCGEGVHHVQDNGKVWMGTRYSEPVSVSIVHWCPEIDGQPSRRIERIGRDYESAAAAWNRRAPVADSAMAKDAERYRFIASKAERGDTGWMYFYRLRTVDIPISQPRATLDEAIDAAIGASAEKGDPGNVN